MSRDAQVDAQVREIARPPPASRVLWRGSMRNLLLASLLLAACGGDDPADVADATPQPDTVLGSLASGGPWMEDFVWGPGYLPCDGCEELSVLAFDDDGYDIQIFTRAPGGAATLGCTARVDAVASAIDGFELSERTRLTLTLGANDCGWTTVGPWPTWIVTVVTRGDDGAPTYLAWWPEVDDTIAAGPFPGYEPDGVADPLRPCATAPDTLCEPSCVLADGGCDLPTPAE